MTYSQRREKILSAMKIVDRLTVHQIVELTEASEATIRRDLARMESAGDIKRCWGGVGRSDTPDNLRKSSLQNHTISNSHEIIGKIAAEQVKDGELIFIGSGMTTLSMIPHIKSRNIHVITNGVPQLEALHEKGIQTLLLCGFFKEYSRSLVGKETVNMLRDYNFDRAFLGANGMDDHFNILSADDYEDTIKTITIRQSKHSYVMVKNTKFSKTAFYVVPNEFAKDTIIITDQPPFPDKAWERCYDGYCARIGDLTQTPYCND